MKRQKSEKNSILSLHIVATMAQFSTHSSVSVRCKRAPWLSSDPALKLWWWWWKFTLDWWHVEQLSKDTNDGQLTSTLKNFGVSNHLFQTMKNWKWNSNKSMVWWRRFANSRIIKNSHLQHGMYLSHYPQWLKFLENVAFLFLIRFTFILWHLPAFFCN